MPPENWARVKKLFAEAVAHDPEARDAFIDQACGGDAELRAQLVALLAAHDSPDESIDLTGRFVNYVRGRKFPAAAATILLLATLVAGTLWKYREGRDAADELFKPYNQTGPQTAGNALRTRRFLDDLAELREAIRANPYDANLYFIRGQTYLKHDRWKEAIEDFTATLDREPERGDAYAWRGRAYQQLTEYDAAIDDYRQAIRYRTAVQWIWVEWSGALLGLGRGERIAGDLVEMLDLVDSAERPSARAYEQIAELCNSAPPGFRDAELAWELALKARDLKPADSSYLTQMGVACYRRGDFAQAVEHLERRIKEKRGGPSYYQYLFLAMSYHELGRTDEAESAYNGAIQWFRENEGNLKGFADRILYRAFRAETQERLGKTHGAELPELDSP